MKVALVVLLFIAFVSQSFIPSGDEPRYKNLKVLPKNISKPQMDSIMKSFTVALGVKCNFCHVRNEALKSWDFPSDGNKHKDMARQMMRMTATINKKFFDVKNSKAVTAELEVTCYTCHGGKAHPAKFPAAVKAPADTTRKI